MQSSRNQLLLAIIIVVIIAGGLYYVTRSSEPQEPDESPDIPEPAQINLLFLEINPAQAKPGENVTINVGLNNTGGSRGSRIIEFMLNGSHVENKTVELEPGVQTTAKFVINKKQSGFYDVNIGGLSGSFKVLKPAAFNVSNLEVTPLICSAGEEVYISIQVSNYGELEGNHTLELLINEEFEESIDVTVEPGSTSTVVFQVSKETNKLYQVRVAQEVGNFTVLKPAEFVLSNFVMSPLTVGPGRTVNISVDVMNIGEISGEYTVELKVDGAVEKSKRISLLGAEQTQVCFTLEKNNIKYYYVEIGKFAGRFEVASSILVLEWGGQGGGGGLFNRPMGIAVDNEGFIYVADDLNNRIQKFTSNGTFVTMWGEEGHGAGQFDVPIDVDVDNNGYVYVAEGNGPYVQKFTSDGIYVTRWNAQVGAGIAVDDEFVYITTAYSVKKYTLDGDFVAEWGSEGSGDGQFTKASGIAVNDEHVYVTELDREGNHGVQKFTKEGTFVKKWNLPAPCCSWWPILIGIEVDSNGNVYVSNPYESTITKFNSNGNVISILDDRGSGAGKISGPNGICIDEAGNLIISDTGNYRVQKLTDTFSYIDKWGSFGGSGSGYFTMPLDCEVYENGTEKYLYVNEFWNCRVQKFHLNGTFISLWGSNGRGSGEFDYPEAIAVDNNGYVYVSDSGNHRVQKFDLDGNYITEWGSYGTGAGKFTRNTGIAVDPSGEYVYVADMSTDRIQKFRSDGSYVTQWLTEGPEAEMYSPRGVGVDQDGFVYVSEEGPHNNQSRVQKFTPEGVLVQYWYMDPGGSTGTPRLYDIAIDKNDGGIYVLNVRVGTINKFTPEGELLSKWNYGVNGIAVDSEGYVYVVDVNNHKILKIILYY